MRRVASLVLGQVREAYQKQGYKTLPRPPHGRISRSLRVPWTQSPVLRCDNFHPWKRGKRNSLPILYLHEEEKKKRSWLRADVWDMIHIKWQRPTISQNPSKVAPSLVLMPHQIGLAPQTLKGGGWPFPQDYYRRRAGGKLSRLLTGVSWNVRWLL